MYCCGDLKPWHINDSHSCGQWRVPPIILLIKKMLEVSSTSDETIKGKDIRRLKAVSDWSIWNLRKCIAARYLKPCHFNDFTLVWSMTSSTTHTANEQSVVVLSNSDEMLGSNDIRKFKNAAKYQTETSETCVPNHKNVAVLIDFGWNARRQWHQKP